MSFAESVIIPLELFEKCQLSKNKPESILFDQNLPKDVKMKLFDQEKIFERNDTSKVTTDTEKPLSQKMLNKTEFIVDSVPISHQPYVRSILKFLKDYPDQISWNDQHEIIIDGKPFPNSNIMKLFQFLMKTLVITSASDVPVGGKEFFDKLREIGVPQQWVKITFPRKTSRKSRKRTSSLPLQIGNGKVWISL